MTNCPTCNQPCDMSKGIDWLGWTGDESDLLYRKHGRRYHPVRPFDGFPTPGVYLIRREAGQRRMDKVATEKAGPVPDPMTAAQAHLCLDVIAAAIKAHRLPAQKIKGGYIVTHDHYRLAYEIVSALADEETRRREQTQKSPGN